LQNITLRLDSTVGRVLLVSPWYKESLGGVATVADRLLRLLPTVGVDSSLLVIDGTPESDDEQDDRVWYRYIPPAAFHCLRGRSIASILVRGSLVFWQLARYIKAEQVQTILIIFPTDASWMFRLLRLLPGTRLIVSCHGNDVTKYHELSAHERKVLRGVLLAADAIVVCADHLAEKVKSILPSRRPPITIIPNCVDVDYFTLPPAGFKRNERPRTVIHVSNFATKKRTPDIIEAFARADLPSDSRLVMVGAGPDLNRAMDRAQSLCLARRVEFVGRQKDVRPFLWSADLFVLASDDEGAPLVLLEAMACGLPWVSTPWGVAATVPNGECGLVVPPASPHQLAAAMTELMNDPQRCSEMGLRGRRRVEADFTLDKYLNQHLKVLREARMV